MSDEDAFLRAIQAAPDDDLPKLVYADWLDESGQPEKAAYVRLAVDGHAVQASFGAAWYDLYTSGVRMWDVGTLLAFGRLQGFLNGLAAGNDHTADVSYCFAVALYPFDGAISTLVREVYPLGEPTLVAFDDWRGALRAELARWIGMEQEAASPRATVRRAHQTTWGCERTADRVLELVTEMMTPEQGWQVQPPADQRWGIDFSHFLLAGSGRGLSIQLDFDD